MADGIKENDECGGGGGDRSHKKMKTMDRTSSSSWYGSPPPPPTVIDSTTTTITTIDPGKAKIFYKTKLCSKFKESGNCPFESRCTFAHGAEELRRPAAGWENLVPVAAAAAAAPPASVDQQPDQTGGRPRDSQKFFKTRPCKFFRDGSCPYGDRCTFLHDEVSSSEQRPPNWKTRICNQWESTGHCSFAEKCHFAHGVDELQNADCFQHQQLAHAAIYDCGFALDSFEFGADGQQSQQLSQYPTNYSIQQVPYLYGYGVYHTVENGSSFPRNGNQYEDL